MSATPPFGLSTVTGGLTTNGTPPFVGLATLGLGSTVPGLPIPPPSASEVLKIVSPSTLLPGNLTVGSALGADPNLVLLDPSGNVVVPGAGSYIPLGSQSLSFDPGTLQGRIQPVVANKTLNDLDSHTDGGRVTYTGSDLKVILEMVQDPKSANGVRLSKQLLELTTISVSVHRAVAPVRSGGFINPKDFVLGGRTIAGSLIMTQFTSEVLLRFLQGVLLQYDVSKDSHYSKPDQLPPFNMTLLFSNEQGFASYRRLLGVRLVTDGITYSQSDMISEQTLTYYAADFTPLLPLNLSSLMTPIPTDPRSTNQKTFRDVASPAPTFGDGNINA